MKMKIQQRKTYSVKAVLRGRFIALKLTSGNEKNQINNPTLHLKQLEMKNSGLVEGKKS